ncbi:PEP-CTERM sorting domain-containing protein [Massilia arenosa]|uniref:PEP-CTERM sorting domain-containing protein n=1 Tax=Zemynaea arenosa TaxID=2561931 RepID=A0A4Y9SCT0_9BURK|nr:PEP-CTERM sorting domain-containing protein [Massilia arenosa]TFW20384.1 PEP-CTERM sorting domain-containing protein [Massilia arenosa]
MKRIFLASLFAALSLSASATVLTFDDYPGATLGSADAIRGSYHGYVLGAENSGEALPFLAWVDTGSPWYWPYGSVSGSFTGLNNWGGVGTLAKDDGSDFAFDGVWARTWGTDERDATIYGYNNGVEVWSSTFTLNGEWTRFTGGSGAVDQLRFDFGNFFLIDDVALSDAPRQGTVPEPASLALFGLGLAGAAAVRRKRAA